MSSTPLTPLTPPGAPTGPAAPNPGAAAPVSGPGKFSPIDPVRVLRQYAPFIIVAAILGLGVGWTYWWFQRTFNSKYATEAQLFVSPGIRGPYDNPLDPSVGGERLGGYMSNQIVRLRSDSVLSDALKRPDIRDTEWFKSFPRVTGGDVDTRLVLKDLKENLAAAPIRGTSIINITLTGPYPRNLPVILDGIIATHLQQVELDFDRVTSGVRRQYVNERDQAIDQIRQITEQAKAFAKQNDLPMLETRGTESEMTRGLISEQYAHLKLAVDDVRNTYEQLLAKQQSGQIDAPSPDELAQIEASPEVAGLSGSIRNMQLEREIALHKYGEGHQFIKSIDVRMLETELAKQRQIQKLLAERQQLQIEAAKSNLDSMEQKLAALKPKVEEAEARLRDVSEKLQEHRRMQESLVEAQDRRNKAENLLNNMRLTTARDDSIRIRQTVQAGAAELTYPMARSIIPTYIMGFAGLVTGLAFLRELLDQRIKSPADIKLLPGADLLGVLPATREDPSGPETIENIVVKDPTGLMAESFRQTRTALLSRIDRRGYKTLLLVGAQAGSGVSSFVNNLASSLAYNGRRVVVIDANLRRPAQHTLFDAPRSPGLAEVLHGAATLDQALFRKDNPGVHVLTLGQTDVSPDMLESQAFRNLLRQLEAQYDVILIDAPPALVTSEAQLLIKLVDAVAVVVRAMKDKRGMVYRMLRQLDGQRADVLGIVLNGVRSSAGGYFRKNYKEFYNYRQQARQEQPAPAAEPAAN